MHVVILGASGRAGSEITKEIAARGHRITAIARNAAGIPAAPNITPVAGTLPSRKPFCPTSGAPMPSSPHLHFEEFPATALVEIARSAGIPRLIITGGAGSLEIGPGRLLVDIPEFPAEIKPLAQRGVAFLQDLRKEQHIDWTFFSPSAYFEPGPRLGHFRLGRDQLVTDANGHSRISFADYAIAMADELEQHRHSRARFTAAY